MSNKLNKCPNCGRELIKCRTSKNVTAWSSDNNFEIDIGRITFLACSFCYYIDGQSISISQ